jgi:hypothetical protein
VQQALCIDTAFGYWRRLRSEPQGLTMGILYWQLNDVWAGASWSGIDYEVGRGARGRGRWGEGLGGSCRRAAPPRLQAAAAPRLPPSSTHCPSAQPRRPPPQKKTLQGRYKPMQYRVKHHFSDFVVQTVLDNGNVQVFVVSDDTHPTTAKLDLAVYRLAGAPGAQCGCSPAGGGGAPACASGSTPAPAEPVWSKTVDIAVPALNSAIVVNASLTELLGAMPKCSPSTCFLRATASAAKTKTKPAQTSSSDLFFKAFKDLKIETPNVTLANFQQGASPDAVTFEVSTDASAALLVVLDSELRGVFSENMVNLPPCATAKVTFKAAAGAAVTPEEVKASLAVTNLWENQDDASILEEEERSANGTAAAAPGAKAAVDDKKKAKKEKKGEENAEE